MATNGDIYMAIDTDGTHLALSNFVVTGDGYPSGNYEDTCWPINVGAGPWIDITIVIDPWNKVHESDESDNTFKFRVAVP